MPEITEVHWALWYGLVYFVCIVGAWVPVTLVWIVAGLRRTARPAIPARPAPPDLVNDPELQRFFARVNPTYRRQRVPPHAAAPLPSTPLHNPQPAHERPDPQVMAEAPEPVPVRVMPDPAVLHSAPFYSPRPSRPSKTRIDPQPEPEPVAAPAPAPQPATAQAGSTEPDLIALVNLWAQLSDKDRRELLALARIKAGLDK